MQLKIS